MTAISIALAAVAIILVMVITERRRVEAQNRRIDAASAWVREFLDRHEH